MRRPWHWAVSVLLAAGPLLAVAAPFAIAVAGDLKAADVTTHEISSGAAVLGVSDKGGGYINKLVIPGIGDVIGLQAARYGRGGQVTLRDVLHGLRYNPTQAGFTDRAGTHVEVVLAAGEIRLPLRPVALWHGDRQYDFIEWENLAADPYTNDGGRSDLDKIDESSLPGKQADEITSEFDFVGSYSSAYDGRKVKIPAFRFQYEFRYARKPRAILQFGRDTPIYDPAGAVADISVQSPPGVHPATPTTLSKLIMSSTLRGDKAVWDPNIIFTVDKDRRLVASESKRDTREAVSSGGYPLVILSRSKDPGVGPALGFFHPANPVNVANVVGRSAADHTLKYEDRRATRSELLGNLSRTGEMWLMGMRVHSTGLLSTLEAPSGTYEAVRGESFILIGTPREILEAATALTN